MDFENVDMFITAISNSSAKTAARKALTVGASHKHEGGILLSSSRVTKRGLKHAPAAFDILSSDSEVMGRVQQMMRGARARRVWMITGVLLVSDAHVKTNALKSSEVNIKAAAQIPTAAVMGLTPVGLEALDIEVAEVSASKLTKSSAGLEVDLTSRRVFAVQYWRCELQRWKRQQLFGQWRGQMTLRGKGIQKVETGHMGLGDSESEDEEGVEEWSSQLSIAQREELPEADIN
ncbi:hypothetical protein N7490_009191 [Penicillium lividum]|nr:hypothetical protein N7490_009191 [Penicillium lividum]